MITVKFIDANGIETEVEANAGDNLMEVAVHNMIDGIIAECGGSCSCATCHCYIDSAWLDKVEPAAEYESSMLECVAHSEPNSRLSCQVELTQDLDGIVVRLPKSQL